MAKILSRANTVLAVAISLATAAAVAFPGCSSDDNNAMDGSTDQSTSFDTTQKDSPSNDTGVADTGTDGSDGGGCMGYDAAGLDDASVQAGLALVLQLKCYNCHQNQPLEAGLELSGKNTSLQQGGAIFPPNLTSDIKTGLGCWTNDQIKTAILYGYDDMDAALCVMPKFITKGVEAGSADQIVQFLRSLPIKSNQVPDTMCPPPADAAADAPDGD
jgi:hypothetical protein